MGTSPPASPDSTSVSGVFARVLVDVDHTPDGLAAGWQARVLAGAHGQLSAATDVGGGAPVLAKPAGGVGRGSHEATLLAHVAASRATCLALGAGSYERMNGRRAGLSLVRHCPCSVLIARERRVTEWPSRIVVGVDGSSQSYHAAVIAADLARIHRAELLLLAALGGKVVDIDRIRERVSPVQVDPRPAVDALVAAGFDADLIVIASRGRHGVGPLGSVSERVAERAMAPVLIVRAV